MKTCSSQKNKQTNKQTNKKTHYEWEDLKTGFDGEENLNRQILVELEGNMNEIIGEYTAE